MKRVLFLYNPRSGRGRIERRKEAILAIFRAHGYDVEPRAIDFAHNPFAGDAPFDLAVVAGGDGSVNYLVNSLKRAGRDLPIGVIPAGTANDFAGALGMSKDPVEAARQIAEGTIERIDCGRANDLYFVNIFSFGLFTTTSQRTSDRRKHRYGKLAYFMEGVKELRRMHDIPLHITADGERIDLNSLITLIFNGETAGGFRLARRSSITDGCFDCLLLEKRNLLFSCWTMLRYLLGGSPRAIHHLHARQIEIVSAVQEPTDVDGQQGARFPLSIRCLAGELRVQGPHR